MRSTVSMTLALPCLVMISNTEGSRLYQPAERLLRTPGVIEATVERRMTVPLMVFTTSGSYSVAMRSWSLMPMVTARALPSKVPIGPTALELAIALRTSSMLKPMDDNRIGSTLTRNAGCSEPATVTSATPSTCDRRCAITLSAPILILALTSKTMQASAIYDGADSVIAQRLSQVDGVADGLA